MSATSKIAVHSLPDLKSTTDDFLPTYLHALKFRQIHTSTHIRLALGYSAVVIAGALFYYDWKFGWAASKPYTLPAVVAYFVLNGAFTWWLWWAEAGLVYEGEGKTGKLRISTTTTKHHPLYALTATFHPTPYSSNPPQTLALRAPFTRWFTADGYFEPKPLQQWLASEIPVVGSADPENVIEEIGRGGATSAGGQGGMSFTLNANNAVEVLQQLKASGAKIAGVDGESGRRRKA